MSVSGIDAFTSRVRNVLQVHRTAGDLTNAQAIGCLEMLKLDIYQETVTDDEDEDLENEDD